MSAAGDREAAVYRRADASWTLQQLDEATGFSLADDASSVSTWYQSVRASTVAALSDDDLCRAVRQRIHSPITCLSAVTRLQQDLFLGELFPGELIQNVARLPSFAWEPRPELADGFRRLVERFCSLPSSEREGRELDDALWRKICVDLRAWGSVMPGAHQPGARPARLVLERGEGLPAVVDVGDQLIIGSGPTADVRVARELVALGSEHLRIVRQPGGHGVEASGLGVTHNGKPVRSADLAHGDRIGFGQFVYRFEGDSKRRDGLLLKMADGAKEFFVARGGSFVFGRDPQADLSVPGERLVDRRHAVFDFSGAACTVTDAGSTSGTWVNGARTNTPTPIAVGDVVRLGGLTVSVHSTARPLPLDDHLLAELGLLQLGPEERARALDESVARHEEAAANREPRQPLPSLGGETGFCVLPSREWPRLQGRTEADAVTFQRRLDQLPVWAGVREPPRACQSELLLGEAFSLLEQISMSYLFGTEPDDHLCVNEIQHTFWYIRYERAAGALEFFVSNEHRQHLRVTSMSPVAFASSIRRAREDLAALYEGDAMARSLVQSWLGTPEWLDWLSKDSSGRAGRTPGRP